MDEGFFWITMSYSLPIEPSGHRVYIWRKLREMGAENLRQGVAVLPSLPGTTRSLRELAAKVRGLGGQAVLTEMRFLEEADHRRMVERFKKQSRQEYEQLLAELLEVCERTEKGSSKALDKRYRSTRSRDYFDTEAELAAGGQPQGRLLAGLDLDGGFAELMEELRQGYREISSFITQGGTQGK